MNRRSKKSRIGVFVAMLMGVLMLPAVAGCASSKDAAMETQDMATSENAYISYGADEYGYEVTEEAFAYDMEQPMQASDTGSTGSTQITGTATNRKLIKTVNWTAETEDLDQLLDHIEAKVGELGGYIESITASGSGYRYANLTVRIPAASLDFFLDDVEGQSNITYRNAYVQDVTLDYVDMESHKEMLMVERDRLMELIIMADTVDDIIALESRLTSIRYQIESMESQLRTYDNLVDYSTIYLNIEEVVRYTPQVEKGFWEKVTIGFEENIEDIKDGFRGFAIWFMVSVPYMILWAVIIVGIVLIIKGMIRKSKKKKLVAKMKAVAMTGAEPTSNDGSIQS